MEPNLIESLAEAVKAGKLVIRGLNLTVALAVEGESTIDLPDRTKIALSDGAHITEWQVLSLRALFRGNGTPPDMMNPPNEYLPFLFGLETHVLTMASAAKRPATDDDIMEAFGAIRRRPDGRSLGLVHDMLWQATALALGLWPTSEAEFRALLSRLELSARRWRQFAGSTAYSEFLRKQL